MDAILKSLSLYMMVGIIVVVGVSQVHRTVGGVLGVVFWTAVALIGDRAYTQGGAIGLFDLKFPRALFLSLCVVMVAFHAAMAWADLRRRKHRRDEPVVDDGDEET